MAREARQRACRVKQILLEESSPHASEDQAVASMVFFSILIGATFLL